jgi:hypothetical protein
MRFKLILPIVSVLFLISCSSSKQTLKGYYPERYTVELPKGWSSKPKLVKAITEILPVTMAELKDREFCLNCSTGYKVKIEMTEPNTDQIQLRESEKTEAIDLSVRLFSFEAAFVLYNKENKPIVLMKIVDPEDAYMLKGTSPKGVSGASNFIAPGLTFAGANNKSLDIDYRSYSEKSYSYRPSSKSSRNGPDEKDLLIVTEQKILEIHKLIENIDEVGQD